MLCSLCKATCMCGSGNDDRVTMHFRSLRGCSAIVDVALLMIFLRTRALFASSIDILKGVCFCIVATCENVNPFAHDLGQLGPDFVSANLNEKRRQRRFQSCMFPSAIQKSLANSATIIIKSHSQTISCFTIFCLTKTTVSSFFYLDVHLSSHHVVERSFKTRREDFIKRKEYYTSIARAANYYSAEPKKAQLYNRIGHAKSHITRGEYSSSEPEKAQKAHNNAICRRSSHRRSP